MASMFRGEAANSAAADSATVNDATFDESAPPDLDATFSSVEDALPLPDNSGVRLPFLPIDEPAPEKQGIISRLFRRSKATPRPSLEVEVHEDRISAAAEALNEVGEQTFAQGRDSDASADRFASVEEALPDDNGSFATRSNEPDLSLIDLDLGSTQEIVPPARARDRSRERAHEDDASYFGDTLDPDLFAPPPVEPVDLDKDTDEFEIVTSPVAPEPAPLPQADEDTARISRKSLLEGLMFWRASAKSEAGPGSTIVEAPPAFLFSKFRTFYNEIIRLKHQKTEFTAGFSTAIVADYSADLSPDGAADALSKKLVGMLELQAAEAMWMGGESAERYPDAQYAMAALADETFLYSDWDGQDAWHRYFLETRLFKTRAAEVELFRRIDKLLKDQPDSVAARDLARVYLLVLAAGFRGKYRPFGLTRALAEYRQRLYEYIHEGGDALLIYAPDRRIFPEAAQRTLVGEAVARYTGAQRWAVILGFLVFGYAAIAHYAWSRVSADLRDVTDRIHASGSANGAP